MFQRLSKITPIALLWSSALLITACGPNSDPSATASNGNLSENNVAAPAETSASEGDATAGPFVGLLKVGEAEINLDELGLLVQKFGRNFNAFGPETLAWHLLKDGIGPAAILHQRFADDSATAKSKADEIAARIQSKEDFYAEYQAHGGNPEAQSMLPPTPFGVGARLAAHFAEMEPGDWVGPLQTAQGWEIVILEERAPSKRMVAGVVGRTILFGIGSDDHRKEAREAWAKLPLQAAPAFLRALPASFRRGRVAADAR
jgi:hypothetical protein